MTDSIDRYDVGDYVDIRRVHPDWWVLECWHCGHEEWVGPNRMTRVCHNCFMGQQQVDHDGEFVTDEGYTDYGRLWYGDVDDRAEYQALYEESTAEVRERSERMRAREREVNV